jgi:hypothetical protein
MTESTMSVIYEREHFVQFYHQDDLLIKNLLSFVGAGLNAGDACIVICTQPHLDALNQLLEARGIDVQAALKSQSYFCLDAEKTLARITMDGQPSKERFRCVVGSLLNEVVQAGKPVRAFGEMVALLWAQGNENGALRLERFWNELASECSLTLFCAYPMHHFDSEAGTGEALREISHLHSRAIVPGFSAT